MAHARQHSQWQHTASLAAVVLNLFRRKGQSPVRPETLNPFSTEAASRHRGGIRLHAGNIALLRGAAKRIRTISAAAVRAARESARST